ncbi:MAG: Tetracycline resistance protein, class C [Chlamydiae bacterium]|nr:Tetracycline resistance protein, class C [Chlamydiota bacterium]
MHYRQARILFPVYLTFFLDNMGFAIVFPIFGPMILDPDMHFFHPDTLFATRTLMLGVILACFPLMQLFGAPVLGELSDLKGRKKILTFSVFGTFLGYCTTAFGLFYQSLGLIIAGRLFTGLFAGNTSICMATIADISKDEHTRSYRFGYMAFTAGVSFVIGIVVAGVFSSDLLAFNSFSLPMWIVTILAFMNFLFVVGMFQETLQDLGKGRITFTRGIRNIYHAFRLPKLGFLFFFLFALVSSFELIFAFMPAIFVEFYDLKKGMISAIFVWLGLVWSFGSSYLNKRIMKNRSIFTIMYSSILVVMGGYIALLFASKLVPFLIILSILMVLYSYLWPNAQSQISINADKSIQGKVLGVSASMIAAAEIVASLAGGYLFRFGILAFLAFCLLFVVLGFCSLFLYKRKYLSVLLIIFALFGCTKKPKDFLMQGEWIQKKMIEELQYVHTLKDLQKHQKPLEKYHLQLVDVIESAIKNHIDISPDLDTFTSDCLKEEMLRILFIEGAPKVMEEIQKEALYRLDHL